MENEFDKIIASQTNSINIRAEIEKYLVHWRYFCVSILFFTVLAFLYIKISVPVYETTGTLLIKNENTTSELQAFQDLYSFGLGKDSNVLDEIEILKSRTLTERVVRQLKLNQTISKVSGLIKYELYNNSPIKVEVLSDINLFYDLDTVLEINIKDNSSFEYTLEESSEKVEKKFGEKITIANYSFTILPNQKNIKGNEIILKFQNINKVIEEFNKKIKINAIKENSNIIAVTIDHPIKEKAKLIINTLIDEYNNRSVEDKNLVGVKTDEFITNRLQVIKEELDEIDQLEEVYKKNQQLTDIEIQSSVYINNQSNAEQELFERKTELSLIEFMIDDIKKQGFEYELLPANISVEANAQLSLTVNQYNQVLLERNRLLSSSNLENPIIKNLNNELYNIRENIKESLVNTKKQIQISLSSLKEKESEFKSKISEIPTQIREYTSILRRQKIIAELYIYLLQKKQENEISMAVTVSDSKLIDEAYSSNIPKEPKKKVILLIALFLGVLIPVAIIYINDLLDTKFHTKSDLKGVVTVPVLGDIPFDDTEEKVVIKKGSRTSTAEAFRLLRTNLDFMLTRVTSKSKIIFVTSTISGEGKTFVSVNTAASLALTGKKVLLMGMDLRAPKITQYLDLPNRNGVTNYLIDKEASLSEMVMPLSGYENLDLLSSGIVPPNPAELLLDAKISQMFEELRTMYDYIVVDTAPVNLVTDTLMLSSHADMFLYVSRANYLDKRMLEVPERLYKEKRLPNMAILINGLDHSRGYGYGYGGYGYPAENNNENFLKKIFKF